MTRPSRTSFVPQQATEQELRPDSPLTTKEGWRRFVEHESSPPALLTAVQRAALSSKEELRDDELRRNYHSDLPLVNTPTIQKVIATSRLLVQLNRQQISARRGIIISGASGTGKTTALSQLGRAHEIAVRKRHPRDRARLPVLYVTVPPAATPKMLAMEFARFFGLDFPTRFNITDVVNAVCATAAHVHVDLVLIDELHNLNLATRTGAEASDQLKYLAERLPATFAYAGIDVEDQGLFNGTRGRQIAGRFTVIPATPFPYAPGVDRDAWHSLVGTLESILRLHHHQPGTLTGLSEYLYHRSGGMIGSLSQLIRGAAVLAIEDGSERITEDLLEIVPVDYAAERSQALAAPEKPRSRRRRIA
ncbi:MULTISPECIES: TniB family NTP-binding protein [unclassified Streptomyces]|uniref:TniB family NTP-binding protein n=1 Tax=unclassified Streptomyces TaxID=2593676 RepID=UPI002DDBA6FA|nr:TniB family NTP-binding protein [Streptomyces sp. NBC_00243]WRZ19794.1 TniB family NTP-binding protein [Streptomyces sp. NBC_00243]